MGGIVLTPVVRNLLIINVALFVAGFLLGKTDLFAEWFGLRAFTSPFFSPYQLVTYMFMHGGWQHLIFNMLGLIFLGPLLETFWGSQRFLIFYAITGLGAGVVDAGVKSWEMGSIVHDSRAYIADPTPENYIWYLGRHYDGGILHQEQLIEDFEKSPTNEYYIRQTTDFVSRLEELMANRVSVGASGAIFGILMAFGLLFPNTELMLLYLPIPIKAKYFVLLSGIAAIYMAIRRDPSDNVAHFAHLGGMLFAWITITFWRRTERNRFF